MQELSDRARQQMHELVRESGRRGEERKAQFDTKITGIEEQIKAGRKTPE